MSESTDETSLVNYNNFSYGQLLFIIPESVKKKLRDVERIKKKIKNEEYSLLFNQTCLLEGVYPKYIYIYIYLIYFDL